MVLFLPISHEIRKQILSFIGVLLSAVIALSSTSLIGNAMAGIMLRVSKSYRPGDFIEVGSTRGRVFNQGLFSTEVQIINRDTVRNQRKYQAKRRWRSLHLTKRKKQKVLRI
ncbi:MAG: mechanosensitive ion channel domain-containing protein [Spirochaetota bacterium]